MTACFAVADLHAITVRQEPAKFRRQILEDVRPAFGHAVSTRRKAWCSCRSQVPAHAQLAWLLACHTQFGELSRMTQFKDKSAEARGQHQRRSVYLSRPDGCGHPALPDRTWCRWARIRSSIWS